ncbi:hypothetical protein D3C86_2002810 [compost metagenome]
MRPSESCASIAALCEDTPSKMLLSAMLLALIAEPKMMPKIGMTILGAVQSSDPATVISAKAATSIVPPETAMPESP